MPTENPDRAGGSGRLWPAAGHRQLPCTTWQRAGARSMVHHRSQVVPTGMEWNGMTLVVDARSNKIDVFFFYPVSWTWTGQIDDSAR
jgi:hypothetical protein